MDQNVDVTNVRLKFHVKMAYQKEKISDMGINGILSNMEKPEKCKC